MIQIRGMRIISQIEIKCQNKGQKIYDSSVITFLDFDRHIRALSINFITNYNPT